MPAPNESKVTQPMRLSVAIFPVSFLREMLSKADRKKYATDGRSWPARRTRHARSERRLPVSSERYLHCVARPGRKSARVFRVQPRSQREQLPFSEVIRMQS